jgi:hypothetical protein
MKIKKIHYVILLSLMIACVEPFNIKETAPTNMLVVEGVFSSQMKRHQIFLSRATQLGDKNVVREQGATVTISDQEGNVFSLSEENPGVYETAELSANAGNKYTLHITTAAGDAYASREVPFKDGADIGSVYPKYVFNPDQDVKGIQIYVDTQDPTNQTRFYRWNYTETWEVNAPFPANWVWLGGNKVEWNYDRIDTCYVTDTLRQILIRNTRDLEQDIIAGQKLQFIPEHSHIYRRRYSILVQQFSLSEESYLYWENLRTISEQQGSLSDIQPGSLVGNMISLNNPDETVLGYFEACKVSEKRIFFSAIDFYDLGLKMPKIFRSYCYDIQPTLVPLAELGATMQKVERTMSIWEAFGNEPSTVFSLMPKSCCDCRDQGPTERPSYF